MASSFRQCVIPTYLFACLLLGGSSRSDWPNLVLQLGAIVILGWSAIARPQGRSGRNGQTLAILGVGFVALVMIQLIPLPPSMWSALPGRAPIAQGYDLLGVSRPWLPVSLAPYESLSSSLWLLPPAAVLAGILRLGAYRSLWLSIALIAATFVGVILGALQVTSSDAALSPWYLYSVTNVGQATGLFANSNHMATLMVVTVPFLAAIFAASKWDEKRVQASAGKVAAVCGATLVVLVGIGLNHSLAGLCLAVPVCGASLLINLPVARRRARIGLVVVALTGLLAVTAIFFGSIDNNLTTVGAMRDDSSRYTSFALSLRAAADHFPVGSGVGTFAQIYPSYEDPLSVGRTYINHVHNDYIELALETGLAGALLILAFLVWWTVRVISVWREPTPNYYGRAASIASAAMLAHSLVDFPLRMSALAAVLAMCTALMAGPRRRVDTGAKTSRGDGTGGEGPRHLSIG